MCGIPTLYARIVLTTFEWDAALTEMPMAATSLDLIVPSMEVPSSHFVSLPSSGWTRPECRSWPALLSWGWWIAEGALWSSPLGSMAGVQSPRDFKKRRPDFSRSAPQTPLESGDPIRAFGSSGSRRGARARFG